MLAINSDNTLCSINGTSQTTDVKITNDSVDIINIDKGFINAHMKYKIRINNTLVGYTVTGTTSTQMLDQYKIKIINGKMTVCQQNDSFYENTIVSARKSKHEVEHRLGIYATWKNANNFSSYVRGYYVNIADFINSDVWIEFVVVIQYDDFLLLSNMMLYLQCASEGLKIEIKNKIANNFVLCEVDPCVISRKSIKHGALTATIRVKDYTINHEQDIIEHEYHYIIQHISLK
ncbi:Uncharacterized protein QTN25_008682 [Entamoeba marina]